MVSNKRKDKIKFIMSGLNKDKIKFIMSGLNKDKIKFLKCILMDTHNVQFPSYSHYSRKNVYNIVSGI